MRLARAPSWRNGSCALLLAAAVAGCGGGGEPPPGDEELDRIVEEIDRTVPNVGLGEASPPPSDASAWRTDFERALVPLDEFQPGGPPRDGIPAIDEPRFQTALDVDWLRDREPVIALTVEGETRAYPLQVLTWHEIVNDAVQGVPVAITFCPLCNAAIAFDRRLGGRVLDFGTTGKLRESDLVMYDRQTESWWQQFSGEALVGELAGAELAQLPARILSWREFRVTYPESRVLSRDTGHRRDYGRNPYPGYDDVESPPLFETSGDDDRLPPKERVVFVERGGDAAAVPYGALARRGELTLTLGGDELVVRLRTGVASALDADSVAGGREVGAAEVLLDGEPVPFSEPFWFAVAAFRPDARIVR